MTNSVPNPRSKRQRMGGAASILNASREAHNAGYHRGEYVCQCVAARENAKLEAKALVAQLLADIAAFEFASAA